MKLTLQSKLKLRDGAEIPILGFGTYELDGDAAYESVTWALEAGYRHIDSAEWYGNEAETGKAIFDFMARTSTPRSEIFYTTKLMHNAGYDSVRRAVAKSVAACGLGYVDLYLIHGPLGEPTIPGPEARKESWRAICDAKKAGELRSVGISTFGVRHMEELLSMGLEVPVISQIDLHPFQTRVEVVEFAKKHKIALEAWAPLVRALRFDHQAITSLADKYHKSPAQILIRYSLQKGYVPIPKSASRERIVANTQVFDFELTVDEVAHLDTLDEQLVTDWDPTNCP